MLCSTTGSGLIIHDGVDSAIGPHGYLPFTSSPPHKPSPHPLSCPANRPQPTPATLHSTNGAFGQKLLSLQDANHAESEEGERRETEWRKKKRVSRTANIYASHLLVLSSVSSEKLQALPGEPLIPVTFHKPWFYHTAGSSTLIFMVSCEACKWLKADWNSPRLFTFPQLLPCTVSTSSSGWANPLCSLPFLLASPSSVVLFLPLTSLSVPLFFRRVLSPPLSPSGICLFFCFLPPPTHQTPAAAQTVGQSRMKALRHNQPMAAWQSQACSQSKTWGVVFPPIRREVGWTKGIRGNAVSEHFLCGWGCLFLQFSVRCMTFQWMDLNRGGDNFNKEKHC